MVRLSAWLEMRARRKPPNRQSLGSPLSSRLRFEGAWFCRRWIEIRVMMCSFQLFTVGRGFTGSDKVGARPAQLHAAVEPLPAQHIEQQALPIQGHALAVRGH